jgi:uncharacterized protein
VLSARVAVLRIAPVKGLAAIRRERVRLVAGGVPEDRRLFLLAADGSVVTQRRYPRLTQVVPDLDLSRGTLSVRLPDGVTATSPLEPVGARVAATLFGKDRSGRMLPGAVEQALSDVAGEPLRLVLAEQIGVGWDEGPVSVIGRASAEAVGTPVGAGSEAGDRYRMLVEVEGTAAFEEDNWIGLLLGLGTARLRVSHPLGRCVVINHSPATGAPDWDGLRTLAARGRDRMSLGVIAEVERPGEVAVGDRVSITDG